MQLTELSFEDQPPVDAYGPGFFRVNDTVVDGNLFLSAAGPAVWAGLSDLTPILDATETFDILFVGMGADIAHLPKDVRALIENAGVAAEVMASPSACRTYNILLSEGRRVALAALAV